LALLHAGVAADHPRAFDVLDDNLAAQRKTVVIDCRGIRATGHPIITARELRAQLHAQDPVLPTTCAMPMVAYAARMC
jgi:hypothetical protein